MNRGERNLMVLFLVLSAGATAIALSFDRPEARLFPLVTGAVTTFLVVAYFVVSRVPSLRRRLHAYIEDDVFMRISGAGDSLEEEEAEEASEVIHKGAALPDEVRIPRERRVFASLIGFVVLAWLVGLTIAAPALLLVFMVGYSKRSWGLALVVTASTSAFMYLVFVVVLRLPLHLGLMEGLL